MLMTTAHRHRRHLVQDLRNGHLWDRRLPEHVPQPELRKELDAALKGPDGRRSLEVDKLLKRGAGARELWPHLQAVLVTSTSTEGKEAFAELPVYSPLYSSAHGHIGVNIFPEEPFGEWTYLLEALPAWNALDVCASQNLIRSAMMRGCGLGGRPGDILLWSLDELGLSSDSELTGDESGQSEADFREYAKSLGVTEEDADLLWVAKEAFEAPLPSGWSEHFDPEGRVYFFSQVTQRSSWSHPLDDVFRELIQLINSSEIFKVQSHLQSNHDRAAAALDGWSGPYVAEDGEYFCHFEQGVSTWHNPVEEWQTELAVRQQVLQRCLLHGLAKQEHSTLI
eukprot:g24222.t1